MINNISGLFVNNTKQISVQKSYPNYRINNVYPEDKVSFSGITLEDLRNQKIEEIKELEERLSFVKVVLAEDKTTYDIYVKKNAKNSIPKDKVEEWEQNSISTLVELAEKYDKLSCYYDDKNEKARLCHMAIIYSAMAEGMIFGKYGFTQEHLLNINQSIIQHISNDDRKILSGIYLSQYNLHNDLVDNFSHHDTEEYLKLADYYYDRHLTVYKEIEQD